MLGASCPLGIPWPGAWGLGQGRPLHSLGCDNPAKTLQVHALLLSPPSVHRPSPEACDRAIPMLLNPLLGLPCLPLPPKAWGSRWVGWPRSLPFTTGHPLHPPAHTEGGAPSFPCSLSVPQHSPVPLSRFPQTASARVLLS